MSIAEELPNAVSGATRLRRPRQPKTRKDPLTCTAVVGLGYVGLPLCLQFARSGHRVLGFDVDYQKVNEIKAGRSYITHIASADIAQHVDTARFDATADFQRIAEASTVVICVPTPLNKNREPDISYILETGRAIAPFLQRETLIVLESTTYPGTTDTELREVLERGSGLRAGVDFYLAYSPEREDPGNLDSKVARIPKVVGGFSPACLEKAVQFYATAIEKVVPVSSCRAAEATKLLENVFRAVNIALVNELKVIYHAMGIDIWEVIGAAKTKPFGYMPFYPVPGLGGHCIPIDPFYLTWKAREYGYQTRFIELAGEINTRIPEFVISQVTAALNSVHKPLNGSRILLVGLAYKPNVADLRESATFAYLDYFKSQGALVRYYDPHIPEITPTREHANWTGARSIPWDIEILQSFDLAMIATHHDGIDYQSLAEHVPLIVDTRNVMQGLLTNVGQLWKA